MARPTYGDFYTESLVEAIESYGDVGRIVTLVAMYRKHDLAARSFDFAEWLGTVPCMCTRYGIECQAEDGEVEEGDDILCPRCWIQ